MLVLIGADAGGKKELLALDDGFYFFDFASGALDLIAGEEAVRNIRS